MRGLRAQRRDLSHITDPTLVAELAGFLRGLGCVDVAVVEAPNIYDQFYRHRSVREVAGYFGYMSPHCRLVDCSEEQVPHAYGRGLAQYTIGRTWRDADFRLSFGKMRSHAVEMVHLTLGNIEWLGARCDEYIFCERQAQRETAMMMLLDDCPPHFAVLDGYDSAADGVMGVMGCPRCLRRARARQTFLPRGVDLSQDLHADLWESFRQPAVRLYIAKMCAGYQGTLPRLPELYQQVRSPTLILWGECDKHFPLVRAQRLQATIAGARLNIIPAGEHWMPWHRADKVAARIGTFLEERALLRAMTRVRGREGNSW